MTIRPLLFVCFSLLTLSAWAQTGCPGCITDLPSLPADTIFLADAPAGNVGVYYDNDISFRMPKSTDPVNANDPGTPAGFNINNITIISMANVPPGLSWQPSQFDFDTSEETDGCVKFCGVPLVADTFEVGVIVEASLIFGTQTASFSFPIIIGPEVSNNDGFSMSNSSGCGEVVVDFTNNVPSNGDEGYTYNWNFGNNITSNEENPIAQVYTEPGIYEVTYEATIDTFGFVLSSVTILDDDCGDLIGGADIYIRLRDPDNEIIFGTNPVSDTQIPFNIPINIPLLQEGEYKLEVRDEDPFGDESCGNIYFTREDSGILTDGGLEVDFEILNPIFTVSTIDTVTVLEQPEAPIVMQNIPDSICTGNSIELMCDYLEDIQWYKDSSILFGQTEPTLTANASGLYWVVYTAANGCQAQSNVVDLTFFPTPATPVFSYFENLLSLNDTTELPNNYLAQWALGGMDILGANDLIYCMKESGNYTLTITDADTGCSASYSFAYTYNPDFNCDPVSTEEAFAMAIGFTVFPNPSNGALTIQFDLNQQKTVLMELYDVTGRRIHSELNAAFGAFAVEKDFSSQPAGVYYLRIVIEDKTIVQRLIFN